MERSKDHLRPVHGGSAATTTTAAAAATTTAGARKRRGLLGKAWAALASAGRRLLGAAALGNDLDSDSQPQSAVDSGGRRIRQADPDFAGDEEEDGEEEEEAEEEGADVSASQDGGGEGAEAEGEFGGADGTDTVAVGAAVAASTVNRTRPPYMVGGNIIMLSKLWALDKQEEEQQQQSSTARTAASGGAANGPCRPTNVLFKFVDGDFNDAPYSQQLATIFRTGTHGLHAPSSNEACMATNPRLFDDVWPGRGQTRHTSEQCAGCVGTTGVVHTYAYGHTRAASCYIFLRARPFLCVLTHAATHNATQPCRRVGGRARRRPDPRLLYAAGAGRGAAAAGRLVRAGVCVCVRVCVCVVVSCMGARLLTCMSCQVRAIGLGPGRLGPSMTSTPPASLQLHSSGLPPPQHPHLRARMHTYALFYCGSRVRVVVQHTLS